MQNIVPILIVGGGPVGLALAIDLGWRGLGATLVDQGQPDARQQHPRMDNVGIRTMEFCRRWGIAEAVEHGGFPRDLPVSIVYATGVLGHTLARDDYPAKADAPRPPFSPERHELCPQNFFDPVLQQAAGGFRENRLHYGQRLTGLVQHADHVEVAVECVDTGLRQTICAGYVAACDGAGSRVAELLGEAARPDTVLSFSTNIFIHCPALALQTESRRAYRYILVDDDGVWGSMVNIDGRDVWRLQIIGDSRKPDWSADEIAALVRKGMGADVAYTLLSWMPWSRREHVAGRFRIGRCFLVGDAAHQMSPTGGYGMNTGIAEAVDLSWKLAAVHSGWGGQDLLDSYDTERRPVAIRNVRQASENLAAMRGVAVSRGLLSDDLWGEAARAETGIAVQAAMRREWHSFGIHLGAVYAGSPIVADDDEPGWQEPPVDRFGQAARPGARAPHVWISPGRSTLDLFGAGFVLLDLEGSRDAAIDLFVIAAERIGLPLRVEAVALAEVHAVYGHRYALVRPDGHVAWRGDALPADPSGLLDRVRGARAIPTAGDINSIGEVA